MSKNPLDWKSQISRLEGAYAPSTIKSYHADMESFAEWCASYNVEPLPADPSTLCNYLVSQAETMSASTVNRRIYSIRRIHRLLGLTDTTRCEEVHLTLRRIMRSKTIRPKQARGMTREYLDLFLESQPDTLAGLRNRALFSLAYEGLTRRSELPPVLDEDVTMLPDGTMQVLIRRSKADPFGQGRLVFTSRRTAAIVNHWRDRRGDGYKYLFIPIYQNKPVNRALSVSAIKKIIRITNERLELGDDSTGGFSGHSMRVGAAQDLLARGFDIAAIMRAGGWKSVDTVSRYLEHCYQKIWL